VPSELISGPDLGAGFLHQLSLDREGEATTFTYHAQVGGADANGPPKGGLEPFGFTHPPAACMFGGPRCWHRRFLLPFAETPKVRQAYNRNRFVLETMMGQAYAGAPVAFDAAVEELVSRLTNPLHEKGVEWYLGGSAAARLLGADLQPGDIDLGTTREGVDVVGSVLREYLIEPVAPTDWPKSGIVLAGRAFIGTFQAGARVEWAVPIEPRTPPPYEEWSGRAGVARLETVRFGDHTLRVTRPEYDLVRAAEHGRKDRVSILTRLVRERGTDFELLDALLRRSTLARAGREALRASVTPP